MEIKEVIKKEEWEGFLLKCKEKTFLQSWNWGEFQKKEGNKIWRLGAYENSLSAACLVVKVSARRGDFLLVPHGPVGELNRKEAFSSFLLKLKELAFSEKASFVRFSPVWERSKENEEIFSGLKKGAIHSHPEASWVLDISPSEEELLSNMRKTTRYLIRQAEKNEDIEVISSSDVIKFHELNKEVSKVQKFVPFSLKYLENEFSSFKDEAVIFLGKYKGEVVASSFVVFWQDMAFYHHAALLPQFHKIPLAYLLQWSAIKEAKKRGCKIYDFWGFVDPKEEPNHPWAGPTLFKMGFGGYAKKYVRTKDLPISFKYYFSYIIEKARKIKRGL